MNHEHHNSSEEVYRLHIDASPKPAQEKIRFAGGQRTSHHEVKTMTGNGLAEGTKAQEAPRQHQPKRISRFGFLMRRLWDKVEFIAVSAAVFGVIYVLLNWQALSLNVKHYWNVWRGFESPLERLVQEETGEQDERLAPIAQTGETITVPPLDIEVYPPDMRVVIPRINQNVPVVGVRNENLIARRWEELESDIQNALRNGVVHYPGTALPGDNGNVVITGHSSYYAWDPGRFKDVFALLHQVKQDDKVVVYFNQQKFIYQIDSIKIVSPDQVDVLAATDSERLTLITCTPIGTNINRLVLEGRLLQKT